MLALGSSFVNTTLVVHLVSIKPAKIIATFFILLLLQNSALASLTGNYSNKLVRQHPPATLIMPALVFLDIFGKVGVAAEKFAPMCSLVVAAI